MNEFDDESRVLELFRTVPTDKVCILFDDVDSRIVYESIVVNKNNWIDNSGKAALPPDYLNPTESLMMEIMRVNDTNSESYRRETELQVEIRDSGILQLFPKAINVTCVPDVHSQSYDHYLKSFTKTIEKHNSKICNYKKNHPGINKIVFLVFDESESYYECHSKSGAGFNARVHMWFFDRAFMSSLKMISADTVIWFSPYKALERDGLNFPDVVVINPQLIDESKLENYDSKLMIDTTKVQRIKDLE
jgi:hypothetical protein